VNLARHCATKIRCPNLYPTICAAGFWKRTSARKVLNGNWAVALGSASSTCARSADIGGAAGAYNDNRNLDMTSRAGLRLRGWLGEQPDRTLAELGDDRRIGHRWRSLQGLNRAGAVHATEARRRGGDGQFVGAQSGRDTRADRSLRRATALSAALLARLEPDRKGLVQVQKSSCATPKHKTRKHSIRPLPMR